MGKRFVCTHHIMFNLLIVKFTLYKHKYSYMRNSESEGLNIAT